jgi:glutathione gamma-glutamylcysteinyltransferase
LVLDTARFKYPPHWLPVELLFAAMQCDLDSGETRGWMLLRKSPHA